MTTEKIRNEAGSSSSGSSRGESVVVDVGGRRGLCGYCKSGGRTSISYGQNLIPFYTYIFFVYC